MQELRSQLQIEKTRGEELWEELSDTEQTLTEVRTENLELKKTCDGLRSELVDREKELAVALAALTENPEPEKKSAPGVELPEAADLLNQLKSKRKKSRADLADLEAILEILEA